MVARLTEGHRRESLAALPDWTYDAARAGDIPERQQAQATESSSAWISSSLSPK